MKTASMVMGIIGGSLALLIALFLILGGAAFLNRSLWEFDSGYDDWEWNTREAMDAGRNVGGGLFITFGVLSAIGGAMGLIAGIIVKKSNVAAGVLMIISAVICLIVFFNFVSMILFILGAVFAFVKEKPQYAAQPYPPQPYPPYPPYPPAPPQQPQDAPKE